jgi:DNA-binding NtrC family response regulator
MPIIKASSGHAPNRILLVEDDSQLCLIIQTVASQHNFNTEFESFSNVEAAQKSLQTSPRRALVLCDHFLEGKETGLDFWTYCQEHFSQNPFVMMSGMEQNEFFKLVTKRKVAPQFLKKPLRPADVLEILAKFIPRGAGIKGKRAV